MRLFPYREFVMKVDMPHSEVMQKLKLRVVKNKDMFRLAEYDFYQFYGMVNENDFSLKLIRAPLFYRTTTLGMKGCIYEDEAGAQISVAVQTLNGAKPFICIVIISSILILFTTFKEFPLNIIFACSILSALIFGMLKYYWDFAWYTNKCIECLEKIYKRTDGTNFDIQEITKRK